MKRLICLFMGLVSVACGGQKHHAWTLASKVFAETKPAKSDRSAKARMEAAEAFLQSLNEAEKKQLLLPFDHKEKKIWTNVPTKAGDGGLRLGDLKKEQLEKAVAFLSTVMSEAGYLKVRNVLMADDLLIRDEERAKRRGGFGSANFWLVIFGKPSMTEPWGVQWDGHHVAVNLTMVGEKMSLSPYFIGTQPHKFDLGDQEIAPMKNEALWAHEFMAGLDEGQRKKAIVGKKRGRMQAGAGRDGVMPEAQGLPCSELNENQFEALVKLVGLWVGDLPEKAAKARMAEVRKDLKKAKFAWYGPVGEGSDASYHLVGPGIIVEYTGQDLGGNPLDHIHSIYRDPRNEYGAKWLK